MRYIAFDLETHLIKAGLLTPRMVCLSFAEKVEQDHLGEPERVLALHAALLGEVTPQAILEVKEDVSTSTGLSRGCFAQGLMLKSLAPRWLRPLLLDPGVTLVGHNISFDLGVVAATAPDLLRLIFEKYKAGLIHDTQIRQQLIDVATGEMKFHVDEDDHPKKTSYHMDALALRVLGKHVQKKDTWRLKYALLDGVPLAQWPAEAITYSVGDSVTTAEIHTKQDEIAGGEIPNSAEQHRAAWGLHLMSAWGIRTDGAAVKKLHAELSEQYAEMMLALRPSGLFSIKAARVLKSGPRKGQTSPEEVTKHMAAIYERVAVAYAARGVECPTTPTKRPATDKKTLTDSGDADLKALAESGSVAKLLSTYIPILESGTRVPINPRYNVLVETGRTSCAKPNIQNPPRGGGVRACFVPRPDWVYVFSDYDTLELRALAQVCLDMLGRSEMAEALRRGEDLHLALAAEMLKVTLEEAKARFDAGDAEIKEYRQQAKPANFGFPGGMAADSFREYAEGYGIFLSKEQADNIHATWFRKWPEMRAYFGIIKNMTALDGPIRQIRSNRVRGGASFCAAANGFFQGLAADGAKEAVWRVAWECYVDEASPLFGCRPVFFIHDEIGMEVPYTSFGAERSSRAAQRLSDVMREAMEGWIPDVPISCSPIMVRRWYKGASPVKNSAGYLVPSKPVTTEKDGKKRTMWVADE